MTLLVLGLVVFALGLVVRRGEELPASRAVCLLAYLAPALTLVAVFAMPREEARRFRLALLGVGFRGAEGQPFQVGVGGDRKRDEVWVATLDEPGLESEPRLGEIRFTPRRSSAGKPAASLLAASTTPTGFLASRPGRGKIEPLQAIELTEGDRIEVAGRSWQVVTATGLLGPPARFVPQDGGAPLDLPRRSRELGPGLALPVLTPLSPAEEVYPLAWLARHAGDRAKDVPGEAFLFRRPGGWLSKGQLWLQAPNSAVKLTRGGQTVVLPTSRQLGVGDAVHVLLPPRWDGASFRAKGFRDSRSFRVETGRRSLALTYETPEIVVLPWSALASLALRERPGAKSEGALRINLSLGEWQLADRSLHLRHASDAVAGEALAVLDLSPSPGSKSPGGAKESFPVATPRGRLTAHWGRPLWLGGERAAAVQFDVISPPLTFAIGSLLLALFAKPWAARAAGLSGSQVAFAALLEALLAVRLLLGYRTWAGAPFSEESFRLALVGWSLLSWGYLAAAARPWRRDDADSGSSTQWGALAPLLGGLAFSAAWCFRVGGGGLRGSVWLAAHAALALFLGRRALQGTALEDRLRDLRGRLDWRRGSPLQLPWLSRPWRAARSRLKGWVGWLAVSCLPGVLRLLLVLLGYREAAVVGGMRLQLSLLHVPLALGLEALYLAWLWNKVRDDGRLTVRDLAPAGGFALFGWLVPAVGAHDNGLALVCLPAWLLATCGLALAARRRAAELGERAGRAGLWPLLVLAAYLSFTALPFGARLYVALAPGTSSSNSLRFLGFGYPSRLQQVGERESERLAVMFAALRSYTSRPVDEARYFTSEVSPHLRATALREHASAIYVAGEWGPLGTIGILLLYFMAAGLGWRLAPWRETSGYAERGSLEGRALALLAGLTFGTASLYMVLANYRLTLFTGKNPYLLGLDSTADLLEALALGTLFALGAARARVEDEN